MPETVDFHICQLDFQVDRIAVALRNAYPVQVEWIEAFDTIQAGYACKL